jgi:RND family efflux transporter MFP subunit
MKKLLALLVPLLILAVGVAGAVVMIKARPEPEVREPEVVPPLVRVQEVAFESVRFRVRSQGTVSPRTESVLVPEVAGRVIEVAPSFVSGGFFERDDVLLRIDPMDYRQAVVQAEAEVARARLLLAREEAEAEVAIREWQDIDGGEAPPLTRREPQLAEARAAVNAAEAMLARAQRDLDRTEIRAPYDGRIRAKQADVGQFVAPGTPLATVYAVDHAEIRLPIPDDDLAYVELPLVYRGDSDGVPRPRVTLSADFAGQRFEWTGRIVRTEGEIDPRSRLVYAVARVDDPYGRASNPNRPPLAVGLYVNAEIDGRDVDGVVVLPRSAMRGADRLLIVDDENRLRFRSVDVVRAVNEEVVIGGGLAAGERVCLSPLSAVTDGMRVRTEEAS